MAPEHAQTASPLEHIVQHPLVERPAELGLLTPQHRVTIFSDQIAMLLLAGLLLVVLVPRWARRRRAKDGIGAMVPRGFGNFLEAICQYLREEVARAGASSSTPTASFPTSGASSSSC